MPEKKASRWCKPAYIEETTMLLARFAKEEDMSQEEALSYLVHYGLSRIDALKKDKTKRRGALCCTLCEEPVKRDKDRHAWRGGRICTKCFSEKQAEERAEEEKQKPLPVEISTPAVLDWSPRLERAKKELEACPTREDLRYRTKLLAEHLNGAELAELGLFANELLVKLPSRESVAPLERKKKDKKEKAVKARAKERVILQKGVR